MPIYTLDFLNKNKFRRFPFRGETALTSVDGRTLSNELIVALSVSTTINRANLYISQIFVKDQFIDLVLSTVTNNINISLGRFSGTVIEDYSILYLEQFEKFTNGILTIGSANAILNMSGGYFFSPESTKIEDSTIFYYTPPAVKSFVNKDTELRGRVEFGTLTNLLKTKEGNNIKLSATASGQIASLADRSSQFKNCTTPLIYSVNNALPFQDEEKNYEILDGNVYMLGIKPVVFYGEFGLPGEEINSRGTILAQTIDINNSPLTLDTLCTARSTVLPPINPVYLNNLPDERSVSPTFVGKENYYTKSYLKPVNFIKAVEPEFLSWPQFFTNFTAFVRNKAQGTEQEIITIPQGSTGTVKRVVFRNSAINSNTEGASLQLVFKKNGETYSADSQFSLAKNQAITVNNFEVPFEPGDIFSVYLNNVDGAPYILQVILFYR